MFDRRRAANQRQEAARLQLHESLETFRTLVNLERQTWSVFAATDVLLIAYALYMRVSGPVVFGILVLIALLVSSASIHRHLVPIGYAIYANERTLGSEHGLGTIYGRARVPSLIHEYDKIYTMPSYEQPTAVAHVSSSAIGALAIIVISVFIAAQAILAAALLNTGYPLF